MTLKLASLFLFPIIAAATFAGIFFFFYQGAYDPPPSVDIPYEQITSPAVAPVAPVDTGAAQVRKGLLVVDALHYNSFSESEIATLSSWVTDRGYDVEFIGNFFGVLAPTRLEQMEEKLREADSFLVMLP